jgi:hypothetical protein
MAKGHAKGTTRVGKDKYGNPKTTQVSAYQRRPTLKKTPKPKA